MTTRARFDKDIVAAIRKGKILGIRAGATHRIIGVWAVVVENRVFVRSWGLKPNGWHRAFLEEPRGVLSIGDRELPIRAVQTRSERLKKAVDAAYAAKYDTPGSLQYVKDFRTKRCRNTTTELVPLAG